MKLPSVQNWTIEIIKEIIAKRIFENDEFDFKECLPHTNDMEAKFRLRKTCCSFANSNGGFLIFGIGDNKELSESERMVGFPKDTDFPNQFGSLIRECQPSIGWDFKNPPIELENGNRIHIVFVHKSWKAPHATRGKTAGFIFPKRTNQGSVEMSLEEVRNSFLNFYEKRLKVDLLWSEIEGVKFAAENSYETDHWLQQQQFKPVTFETNVIEVLISDTYVLMSEFPVALALIKQLRVMLNNLNNKIRLFMGKISMPRSDGEKLTKQHNQNMEWDAKLIIALCEKIMTELDAIKKAV